ncbi:hypothetical protein NIES2101_17065 [Calothrix sp. HK-06]|nr:hypothetical protein NIES2101_17065 [Calothrix sp. HK-06]
MIQSLETGFLPKVVIFITGYQQKPGFLVGFLYPTYVIKKEEREEAYQALFTPAPAFTAEANRNLVKRCLLGG